VDCCAASLTNIQWHNNEMNPAGIGRPQPMPQDCSEAPVLIPAYQPGAALVALVQALAGRGARAIIVVNDGSGPDFDACFQQVAASGRVHLLQHAVNLGKGAALKTGMNYALVHFPDCCGVVTADADGQHRAEDIMRVAGRLRDHPHTLVLGVRDFDSRVPWKSRVGNHTTRVLMRLMLGQKLSDTQTGLRGIPAALIPHLLRVASSGYEFELDMLMACKYQGCPVLEEPIQTIYLEGNKSSHFRPVFDSMRIYFLLFRFSVLSLLTAGLDNLVFALVFASTHSIGESQIAGRFLAMIFNYLGARRSVFHSRQRHRVVFPKYVALVIGNGFLSYLLIQVIHRELGLPAIPAKICAEALLFVANFAIQRDLIFTRRQIPRRATDWDRYYTSVPATARLTRRYTTAVLLDIIKRHAAPADGHTHLSVLEIGGANSCFLDRILAGVGCRSYDVVDTNAYGLSLLEQRIGPESVVRLHRQSVLALSLDLQADIVFSVGLVEHFDPRETRQAVLAHFASLRPGGLAILTFPTPTLLYRITRGLIEALGMWKFPDERPLQPDEVTSCIRECGEVIRMKTLWPLLLTQQLVVAVKHASPAGLALTASASPEAVPVPARLRASSEQSLIGEERAQAAPPRSA
jgi:putative flippase GtrA